METKRVWVYKIPYTAAKLNPALKMYEAEVFLTVDAFSVRKEFRCLYETSRFVSMSTKIHIWTILWITSKESTSWKIISVTSILILPPKSKFPKWLIFYVKDILIEVRLHFSYHLRVTCPAHLIVINFIIYIRLSK